MKRKEPKQTNETTKKIIKLIIECVVVVGMVGVLRNDRVEAAADNIILLENRNLGYWEYLSEGVEIRGSEEIEEIPSEEIIENNEITELYPGNINGIEVQAADGIVSYKGTASADSYLEIGNIGSLTTGTYFVSVIPTTTPAAPITFTIQTSTDYGWKGVATTELINANFGNCVFIDPGQYDVVRFVASISAGTELDNSYRPVIFKISDQDVVNEEGITAYINVDKSAVTNSDWRIFNNRTKNTDYIISYTDGTYEGSVDIKGTDEVGRLVKNKAGEVSIDEVGRLVTER